MKIIDKFNLPDHTNRLYKEEAISSIALTREIANKINELVEAYNTAFSTNLAKQQEQDGKIRKAVVYMKDNLLNSMNDLMVTLRDSGFIDDRIEYHCGILKQRLDNLLGAVQQGSTSMDAEIIDGRTGAEGETYATIGNAIRGQIKNLAYTVKTMVTDTNYRTVLPDLNAINEPCTYQLNFTYGTTDLPLNIPYTSFKSNVDELITFKDHYYRQMLIGNNYIYTRFGYKTQTGIVYDEWIKIYDSDELSNIKTSYYGSKGVVTSENYNEILPDANKVLTNSIYQLNFNWASENITANLPYKAFRGRIDELITFADKYYRQILMSDKYIYTRNGVLAQDRISVDYGEWVLVWSVDSTEKTTFIVDKNGGGDYTSLTECMFTNMNHKCEIYVRNGTYDLIDEFKTYFGNDVFNGSNLAYHGLPVQNGTKIFMDSGAVVSFMYDGSNSVVEEYFSPFIMKGSAGEIHGGKIVCKNCRYAIHDDVYADSPYSKSVIEGVYMLYNSARHVGIGGGFGQSSHITVTGCTIINERNDSIGYGIFYHNSASGNSQSYVKIENNYVKDNIVIESYGTSTNVSVALVCGNKCNNVVKIVEGAHDNILMNEFNNVRS